MVRDEFFAGKPLRFAGKCAARAVIPATAMPKSLAENATGLWMSPKAHVVHYPVRGGSEVALVFVRNETAASDDWSASLQSSWVTEPARAFAKSLRDLLDVPAEWKKWSLYELPPLPTWVRGNICLLGDAAHPTLPFLAQGGVLAIEDAAVLARMIARRPDDICQGFTLYERERRPRATRVVAAAKSNGSIYHLDGFLAQARNAAMRISPPEMLMARYDWIYGYRA